MTEEHLNDLISDLLCCTSAVERDRQAISRTIRTALREQGEELEKHIERLDIVTEWFEGHPRAHRVPTQIEIVAAIRAKVGEL